MSTENCRYNAHQLLCTIGNRVLTTTDWLSQLMALTDCLRICHSWLRRWPLLLCKFGENPSMRLLDK